MTGCNPHGSTAGALKNHKVSEVLRMPIGLDLEMLRASTAGSSAQ